MSKRRNGFPVRNPCQARNAHSPRQQRTYGEARSEGPLSLRVRPTLREVLHAKRSILTEATATTTHDSK
jgi:hypothetical protein